MTTIDAALGEAFRLFGDKRLAEAERALAPWLSRGGGDPRLAVMAGQIALERGRFNDAAAHLRVALRAAPANEAVRVKLCSALLGAGDLDGARQVAGGQDTPSLWRIVAFVDQKQGRAAAAIARYRRVVAAVPGDQESWSNLGLLLSDAGDLDGASAALRRALELAPDSPDAVIRFSQLLAKGQHQAERDDLLARALVRFGDHAPLRLESGRAAVASRNNAAAEAAFRTALRLDPRLPAAYWDYGALLESLNRLDDLDALVGEARRLRVAGGEIDLIEAWALRRRSRFAEAIGLAEQVASSINPVRRMQLIGEAADAIGDASRAFAAFEEMNRLSAAEPASVAACARDFPAEVRAKLAALTAERVRGWAPLMMSPSPPAPVFVVGFPRSGTTLTDSFLRNAAELQVLEEPPMLEHVEALLGGDEALERLTDARAEALRETYLERLRAHDPTPSAGRTIVDKFPLHMVRAALIQRLFPGAKLVLVERHPCDVVLSCFMAFFQANKAMVQFQDIGDTARLYDLAFSVWTRAEALLPLDVHRLRYERLVEHPEAELRALTDFLDVTWRPELLDNQAGAARRERIETASFRQVVQPIYTRSVERWRRYRDQLAPVLPILAPWAERMGYTI